MGETTKIAWTDSTVNCWHGCQKVDALCKHCYAEVSTPVRVKRANGLELWGAEAGRSETKGWEADLRRWDREVHAARTTDPLAGRFVFGQSLSDTFEDYHGSGVRRAHGAVDATLDELRAHFFHVIEQCRALTFRRCPMPADLDAIRRARDLSPPPPRPPCSRCGGVLVPGHLVLCATVAPRERVLREWEADAARLGREE